MPKYKIITAAFAGLLCFQNAHAGFLDSLVEEVQKSAQEVTQTSGGSVSGLSAAEMDGGLREALNKGVKEAISRLGRKDGYFGNPLVRIPMPEKLRMVEKGLRSAGMGQYADDFLLAMNRAAEKAVPETAKIFADAISQMSIDDAKKILTGPDDAATDYFRVTSGPALEAAILPIVKEYTEQTEVTKYYKSMMGAYDTYGAPLVERSGVGEYIDAFAGTSGETKFDPRDLDGYITARGVDGLFTVIAEEEKQIRTDPAARTSELLEKVFGTK
jgi:hypothetical protein